jgi:hypothetical protein
MLTDKRNAPRTRRLKQATIAFNNLQSVLTCQVRDVSTNGARLAFESVIGTPNDFIVYAPGLIDKRWARKIWQSNREIGVELY